MNHRIELLTLIAILAACTDHGAESSVEPPEVPPAANPANAEPIEAAPTTTNGAAPDDTGPGDIEAPRPPPPTELHVAAEGRCRYMRTSLVQGKPFVHYSGHAIVQLDADGTPTGTIDTKLAKAKDSPPMWDQYLEQIEHLGGRPDQLHAEVLTSPREGIRGAYRRTANAWEPVRIFGDDASVDRIDNWFDGSLLAFSRWGGTAGAKFAVVRGKPKGPRFDRAMAKTGCSEVVVDQILVLERGDVVALWTCDVHNMFVTHWRKGDLAGNTHDLGVDGATDYNTRLEPRTIATDEYDGYYVLARSTTGKEKLWHGKDAKWKQLDLPQGAGVFQMATDPAGRLWIAGTKLARRDGETWTEIALPDGKPIAELAGVQFGTPWVRNGVPANEFRTGTGGRIWRIADDKATEIVVPPSAFFEDEKLRIERMHFVGPDDMWADAEFVVQRHGKGGPGRYYHSVLHSNPTKHPLRCGELIDGGKMKQSFVPWPTAAGGTCTKRLALLMRRSSWDDTNDYPKFRKALRSVEGVRFVELELGQEKFFTAITEDAALVATIQKKIKKLRPYTFPEVVCGDDAVLEKAGVVVHRELSFAQ